MRVLASLLVIGIGSASTACASEPVENAPVGLYHEATASTLDVIEKGKQGKTDGKRVIRVLLFGDAPTREFQFLRRILFRADKKQMIEPTILLPKGIDVPTPGGKRISKFPTKLVKGKKDKLPGLSDFDVIIAVDPDWRKLSDAQFLLLRQWVEKGRANGLIFVAGLSQTHQLATRSKKRGKEAFRALSQILPVKLEDRRKLKGFPKHDTSRPWTLKFSDSAKKYQFLNISGDKKNPLKGWQDYFWEGGKPKSGKQPIYGFYTYYPVKSVNPQAIVLASFYGPKTTWLPKKQLQPWIAYRRIGRGKTIFLGSGEFWRLRRYDSEYHEQFWLGLIAFAAKPSPKKASSQ